MKLLVFLVCDGPSLKGRKPIKRYSQSKLALVLGNEDKVSETVIQVADQIIYIHTGQLESLNVAVAGGINVLFSFKAGLGFRFFLCGNSDLTLY